MSEEVQNARTVVPKALMVSVGINGILGFGMLVAVLFRIGSISNALTPATGFTFIEVFTQALDSNGFATGLTALLLVLFIFCAVAVHAAASRVTWAFARDDGLPGSFWIKKVNLDFEPMCSLLMISKGRIENQAPHLFHCTVSIHIHVTGLDQHRLIRRIQRHRFSRRSCILRFLLYTYLYGRVPTSQRCSSRTWTMEYGTLRSSDQYSRTGVDYHHLDLLVFSNCSSCHQRDYELEFGFVGIYYGIWNFMVCCVPKAQVHWTYHHFRAIW